MEDYIISQALFLRLVGLNLFFAFYGFKNTSNWVILSNGIQPIKLIMSSLDRKNMMNIPTLFWFSQTDFLY